MVKHNALKEKLAESVKSVLPIALIVALLCLFLVPVDTGLFLAFAVGTVLIIIGMALFSVGSDLSMMEIGSSIGSKLTRSKNLFLIIISSLVLGIAITISEPDLQVLASNVPNIETTFLIVAVSVGVGVFLVAGMLRILIGISLKWLLFGFYGVVFVLAAFSEQSFLSVAFDSGGVTTGPMTVPFIMALGVGVASIRSDEKAKSDSFGLISLCSIGPIISVLILGLIYPPTESDIASIQVSKFADSVSVGRGYFQEIPEHIKDVTVALLPIIVFFFIFQIFTLKLDKRRLQSIIIGLAYTHIGLVLFLLGVNVGFSSLGTILGFSMVANDLQWLLIPLAMLMGWFIIKAEPAVHVLNKQVSELSAGAISEKSMGLTLSIAISIAMGLAMLRVVTGMSIMWFVIPGYLIAIALAFFVPPTFTAIAFDAGGVASGPMAATFMLPFAIGVCNAFGGSVMTDAFGLVALVALMPLITVQTMGALSMVKAPAKRSVTLDDYGDDEIIELWEADV